MASAALKPDEGTGIPGEGGDEHIETPRDFEAEARDHGWSPKEDFKGDESRWVDAETFMKRADEMMPLLKAQNARLKRDFEALKKDLKRATTHFDGAEKRAYERARAELEARIETAVESGDVAAAKAAVKEMGDLRPDAEPQKHTKEEATEALDEFRDANPWYDRANLASASEIDINARLYFDRMIDKNLDKTKEMAPADFFALITEMTLEKYPQVNAKPARQKPSSAVEGGTSGRGGRGMAKSWDNLPEDAKRQYQRFIDRGIGIKQTGDAEKDATAARAYYAKTHDWEGFKQ
jgi:hypothetical protein